METENIFARVLIFYDRYQRNKLNESDLLKILKKYKTRSNELLVDLSKKYAPSFPVPCVVTLLEVCHVINTHAIPKSYIELLNLAEMPGYEEQLDVNSSHFSAEAALSRSMLLAPNLTIPPLDNMSKITKLFFSEGQLRTRPLPNLRAAPAPVVLPKSTSTESMHPFDQMVAFATPRVVYKDDMGVEHNNASPMELLAIFLHSKQRVRVTIRRKHCLRGAVDGFIRAFDRHFNMLLTDADEVYITNTQKKRKMCLGAFVHSHGTMRRHLPQILLRGDNIVAVFKKP